jgi:hypothetical protein
MILVYTHVSFSDTEIHISGTVLADGGGQCGLKLRHKKAIDTTDSKYQNWVPTCVSTVIFAVRNETFCYDQSKGCLPRMVIGPL